MRYVRDFLFDLCVSLACVTGQLPYFVQHRLDPWFFIGLLDVACCRPQDGYHHVHGALLALLDHPYSVVYVQF